MEERSIIVELVSFEAALAHHNSDAYQKAVAALQGGLIRDIRLIEGWGGHSK
ncbi:DUF1330 domain-containing protein [Desulfosediminicola sp.]|uniref:DUF1330 domain-containing protein n=1 Tax=Desulfosediminicola sp. TaxID=2886825 RepID=UPI003AF2A13D